MVAMARGDAALHPALPDDRCAASDRPRFGRHDRRGILFVVDRLGPAHHGCLAGFRYRRRVRLDFSDRPDRRRIDAARLEDRTTLRALEAMTMSQAALATPAPAERKIPALLRGVLVPRLITGLSILLVWETVVRAFAPAYVAKPSTVLLAIPRVIIDPAFLQALGATLAAVAEGLAITMVVGTVIGLLMGRSNTIDRMIRVYINGFNAMPMIIVLPLFSLWFGYSSAARIGTIIFAAIFAITMNVADGARSVPREYLEVSRSFRSGRLRMLTDIVLPASMPYLLAGFRLAAGRALIGAVVAEFFLSIGGLGFYILYNSRAYHHNEAFVGVLLLAGFGVSFELLVNWCTRHFMPWYRRDEKTN